MMLEMLSVTYASDAYCWFPRVIDELVWSLGCIRP